MYEYIEGKIIELNPTYTIIDNSGIGYFLNISLTTYTQIQSLKDVKLYSHFVVRDDAHLLFGFSTRFEREIFRQLISVSGIGVNTARMMLSSLTPDEIQKAIISENSGLLKSIKGIGIKTAQRMIIELRDKMAKEHLKENILFSKDNTIKDEALSALVMLGFNKSAVDKIVNSIILENQSITVEELIKKALKRL